MVKFLTKYLMVVALLFGYINVYAEEPFRVIETISAQVRLSNDGTGIVKNVHCYGCDFNLVKITKNSKATSKGVEVNILEVRKLNNALIMVSFNPETQEVKYIRW